MLDEDRGDYTAADSMRAGGKYRITGSARATVDYWNIHDKKLLTSWLVAQRKAGISVPEINTDVLDAVKLRLSMRFSQKVDAVLLYFSEATTLNTEFLLPRGDIPDRKTYMLMALTESESTAEIRHLLVIMRDMQLLTADFNQAVEIFSIAAKGWERVDELISRRPSTPQAFVAMWFHPSTEDVYKQGIAPAIEAQGFAPLRIDRKEFINKIDDEIIAEIRKSTFVVADFTCETGQVRGGVYYEAGFAGGLGIPVIWTCKDTSMGDLHFDTRQYSHIVWTDPADLKSKLIARIGAVIGNRVS
jgi:nucleoside 2-deoxyribosyltransferase